MKELIKFGIGLDYLPDWSFKEAVREIIQNFRDFGELEETVETIGDLVIVTLKNDYKPENAEFLRVGNSGKRGDDSTIGTHGEGIKMAAMVLLRNGYSFFIKTGTKHYSAVKSTDEHLGEVFAFEVSECDEVDGFKVSYAIPKEEHERSKASIINDDDVIYDCSYGQIVEKPAGSIYVGGLFVCVIDDMNKAYNFEPGYVPLDRDRSVPATFNLEYYSSKINQSFSQFDPEDNSCIEDYETREYKYTNGFRDAVAKKFKPVAEKVGKETVIKFKAKGYTATDDQSAWLKNHKIVGKRYISLLKEMKKDSYSRKSKPANILKSFFDSLSLTKEQVIESKIILAKSKQWEAKKL